MIAEILTVIGVIATVLIGIAIVVVETILHIKQKEKDNEKNSTIL